MGQLPPSETAVVGQVLRYKGYQWGPAPVVSLQHGYRGSLAT